MIMFSFNFGAFKFLTKSFSLCFNIEVVSGRYSLEMRLEVCLDGGHSLVTKKNILSYIQVSAF